MCSNSVMCLHEDGPHHPYHHHKKGKGRKESTEARPCQHWLGSVGDSVPSAGGVQAGAQASPHGALDKLCEPRQAAFL